MKILFFIFIEYSFFNNEQKIMIFNIPNDVANTSLTITFVLNCYFFHNSKSTTTPSIIQGQFLKSLLNVALMM